MNLFVYSRDTVMEAMKRTEQYVAKHTIVKSEEVKDWYMFFCFGKAGECGLVYPCGSLWHQKMYDLVSDNFPNISPKKADFFIVPISVYMNSIQDKHWNLFNDFVSHLCDQLPYWYHQKRHVFFVTGDCHRDGDALKDSIVFKTSCLKTSPHYALHYDVLLDTEFTPIENAKYEVSFMGCLETYPLRSFLPFLIGRIKGETYFDSTPNFFAHLPENTRIIMQNKWTSILKESRFVFCPRGSGVSSIRLFETLAFGRIPIIYSDDGKLPLEGVIDWEKFSIRVPEKQLMNTQQYINEFKEKCNLTEASMLARETWSSYFAPGKLRHFMESQLAVQPVAQARKLFI